MHLPCTSALPRPSFRRIAPVFALLLAACGSDDGGDGANGNGGNGGDPPDGPVYCDDTNAAEICGTTGVCFGDPVETGDGSNRTCTEAPPMQDVKAFDDTAAGRTEQTIDMSCYTTPGLTTRDYPDTFTVIGEIDVFGLDANTVGLNISMNHPGVGPDLGAVIADGVTVDRGDQKTGVLVLTVNKANMPADGVVAFRATGRGFVQTFQFGSFIDPDNISEADCADATGDATGLVTTDECMSLEVNAIAETTYNLIPIVAGIATGMTGSLDLTDNMGRGAVAGEVSDCNRNLFEGVTMGISLPHRVMSYFNGEEDPRPQVGRQFTNQDGIYAALDVDAGEAVLSPVGRINGELVSFGPARVINKADSVTLRSFRGLPKQICGREGAAACTGGM